MSSHNTSAVKSSVVRKLKTQIQTLYPTISADDLQRLFPSRSTVLVSKLSNHMLYYSITGNPNDEDDEHEDRKDGATLTPGDPLFFDTTNGKGELFPTVYALWLVPHLVPQLDVHFQVAPFLFGGADLMLPGLSLPPGSPVPANWGPIGSVRCVTVRGNPASIAIGSIMVDRHVL